MRTIRSQRTIQTVLWGWGLVLVAGPLAAGVERSSEDFYRNKKREVLESVTRMQEGSVPVENDGVRVSAREALAEGSGQEVPGSAYYNKASQNPEIKGRVVEQLQNLAALGAMSLGTLEHDRALSNIEQTAAALQGSNDPEFQKMGRDYAQLASAMKSGNSDRASDVAKGIRTNYQARYNPNYKLSKDENQFLGFLGNLGVQLAMSLTGIFGQVLFGKLMGKMFGDVGKLGLDRLGGSIAEDAMGAAIDGKNSKRYTREATGSVSAWGKSQARSGANEVKGFAKESAFGSNRSDGAVKVDPAKAGGTSLTTSK